MRRCVIFLPGARPPFEPGEGDLLVCADSGYTATRSMGLKPHILVGDMDSISRAELEEAGRLGVEVHVHPRDKDRTDGEIAVDIALSSPIERLVILGGLHGRTDHVVSAFLLLQKVPKGMDAELWSGQSRTSLLRGPDRRRFSADLPVASLLPLGHCAGVSTEGLRWPLNGESLVPGSTRGVHNEPLAESFEVALESGQLLVMRCPL